MLSFEKYLKENNLLEKYNENLNAFEFCKKFFDDYYDKQIKGVKIEPEEREKKIHYRAIMDNAEFLLKKCRRQYQSLEREDN